jgi:hypothetical protein
MSLQDILVATQEEVAALALERSKYDRQEAMFRAAASANLYEKSKLDLKEGEIMLQRARNANRPSILLGAHLSKEERKNKTIYIAEARGLSVESSTPEQAFLDFDRLWTQGEDND